MTRKIWIYLLKEKVEVFSLFLKFCTLVTRQIDLKLRLLRTDGDDEHNSRELNEFCAAKGIEDKMTTPYTPQHNGLTERRTRTLLDMVRCMLKGKGLPHCYWGEITATYVLNR